MIDKPILKVEKVSIVPVVLNSNILYTLQLQGPLFFGSTKISKRIYVNRATDGFLFINKKQDGTFFRFTNSTLSKIMNKMNIINENDFIVKEIPVINQRKSWPINAAAL